MERVLIAKTFYIIVKKNTTTLHDGLHEYRSCQTADPRLRTVIVTFEQGLLVHVYHRAITLEWRCKSTHDPLLSWKPLLSVFAQGG